MLYICTIKIRNNKNENLLKIIAKLFGDLIFMYYLCSMKLIILGRWKSCHFLTLRCQLFTHLMCIDKIKIDN